MSVIPIPSGPSVSSRVFNLEDRVRDIEDGSLPVTATGSTTARSLRDRAADVVNVKDYEAKGDGVTDDGAALAATFAAAASVGADVYVAKGAYLLSAPLVVPSTFHGRVYGPGIIKAKPATTITRLIDMSGTSRVRWEASIDMGQTPATVAADPRCEIGLYLRNARDIDIDGVNVANVRVGRPIYISGTSSTTPVASDGSQRIRVNRMTSVAFAYNTVDEGSYPVVSSDFYAGDGGGIYYAATNALRKSDYAVDPAVTYPATTKDVWFTDCHFENIDRFAVLNAESIHFTNVNLINAYTRGFNISPTSKFITIKGGRVTGGSASQIAFAYGSKFATVDGVVVDAGTGAVGEQTSLKTYFGVEDVSFSNISGVAAPQRAIYVHSSKRIRFSNINLRKSATGATVIGISISAGEDSNVATWETRDIAVVDSSIESTYAISAHQYGAGGTATLGIGGVRVARCSFDKVNQLFGGGGSLPLAGLVEMTDTRATQSGSVQDLTSIGFRTFRGNNLQVPMTAQATMTGATLYPNFGALWYYAPERDGLGGDATRNPAIDVWKNGVPLVYGVDWFVDAANAGKMINFIRLYNQNSVVNGDVLTARRRE
jgi:coenzyme F420-reducing hydrogenase delta subunit